MSEYDSHKIIKNQGKSASRKIIMKKGIDYIGVGVGAVIFDSEGRVFLAKRGREARNESGGWEFPGGSVEFGETLEQAIAREVKEEYGIEIAVLGLLDVVNHLIPEERQHWVSPTYLCRIASGTPRIREPHKCDEIGWFTVGEIPEDRLTIASKKSLESLKKKGRTVWGSRRKGKNTMPPCPVPAA